MQVPLEVGDLGEASPSIGRDPINGTVLASSPNGSLYKAEYGVAPTE